MKISGAESLIMEALWRSSPLTSEQLHSQLGAQQDWAEPTVRTLLRRLVAKGAISATADGRRFLYAPILQRADHVAAESEGLIRQMFGGRLAPLVLQFSQRAMLQREDIEDIRRVLDDLEKGD